MTLGAGCGTGRALPHLRAAVGPTGYVLGFDLTPEMLATARRHGRHGHAALALAARHGRLLREDDLLAPEPLRRLLQRTGWWLTRHDAAAWLPDARMSGGRRGRGRGD